MAGRITIDIASPPDREKLVAEIFVDHEQLCELNIETGELTLELYPRKDGGPWQMPLQELMQALAKAKEQLGA